MFEINVSLNGHHLFATHERSISNNYELKHVLTIFKEKFPKSEGYEITACRQEHVSYPMDIDEFMSKEIR